MSLESKLESLLFAAVKPLSLKELTKIVKSKTDEVEQSLKKMALDYQKQGRGLRLVINNKKYQLTTAEDNASLIKEFLHDESSGELSVPSLETLTIIAYRGPISKQELDRIRGVNCSLIIRNLLLRGLIIEKYNKKVDDNFYTVSHDFVRFLGLNELSQLPDYEKLHTPDTLERIISSDLNSENFSSLDSDLEIKV